CAPGLLRPVRWGAMWSTPASVAARLAVAGLIVAGRAASAGVAGADPEPTPSPSPAASPSPVASPAPAASPSDSPSASPAPAVSPSPGAPKAVMDKDGIYAVGTDIAPGIYTTAGPVGTGTCYWKRTGNP